MDMNYMREFLVFTKTLNYTSAAKKLYISQPTLSQHIASLEKEVGVPLVIKKASRTYLTPAGRHFVSATEGILESFDCLVDDCRAIDDSVVSISITGDNAHMDDILLAAQKKYSEMNPGKSVELQVTASGSDRAEALDKGIIDFDIGRVMRLAGETADIDLADFREIDSSFLLKVEEFFPMVSKHSPLFGKTNEALGISALDGCTILMSAYDSSLALGKQLKADLKKRGVSVRILYKRFDSLLEHFYANIQEEVLLVTESLLRNIGVNQDESVRRILKLTDYRFLVELYLVYKSSSISNDARDFIEALRLVTNTEKPV